MSPHSRLPPPADMRVLIARVRRAIIVYCHFAEAPNLLQELFYYFGMKVKGKILPAWSDGVKDWLPGVTD